MDRLESNSLSSHSLSFRRILALTATASTKITATVTLVPILDSPFVLSLSSSVGIHQSMDEFWADQVNRMFFKLCIFDCQQAQG